MTGEMQEAKKAFEPKPKALYAKLAEVMGEIGYVEKRGRNQFHGYSYATEADLADAVRSKLAARNVIVIPTLRDIDERSITTAKGKGSTVTTARIAFTFCDGDSGQTHTAEWAGAGEDAVDKGLYKAMTGAAKYFLMKSFLIPTGDDPEADSQPQIVDVTPPFGPTAGPEQTASLQRAIGYVLELEPDDPSVRYVVAAIGDKAGYLPAICVQAIGVLAGTVRDLREIDDANAVLNNPGTDAA